MSRSGGACRAGAFSAMTLCLLWPAVLPARYVQIDDSGTESMESSVNLRWKSLVPPRGGIDNTMIGSSTLRVRLDVSPWLRRNGRVYLYLPAQAPGPITMSWITHGRFMPGQIRSGSRVLIYSGAIVTPFLEDTLSLQYAVDGSLVDRAFPVTLRFEMDED